jgi:uncharacterized protein (DUF4415 family)
MKKTSGDNEVTTSERARAHGLRRIPRRHLTQPGEVSLADCKVRVTMYLDADVIEHFKERAAQPNAAPYQTQINSELRTVMERKKGGSGAPYASLIEDDRFINAVARRVQERRVKRG